VATLDHDAERIFTESYEFVRRLSDPAAATGESTASSDDAVKEGTAGG